MPESDWILIEPRKSDVVGFPVQRALPHRLQRHVGPFVFLDQMGPADIAPGRRLEVAPHPHIGLSTLTYLVSGEILHRDSLGVEQLITPGDVNWMTAGRGIVHSERTPETLTRPGERLFGLQAWIALPRDQEECDPAFTHHGVETLPVVEEDSGVSWRLLAGRLAGQAAPVPVHSPLCYADIELPSDGSWEIPPDYPERAIYVLAGNVQLADQLIWDGRLVVIPEGASTLRAGPEGARVILLGGEPLDGRRHIWWNFVSSSRERIEAAKRDWAEHRFPPVPGDDERIPLPEPRRPAPVNYP